LSWSWSRSRRSDSHVARTNPKSHWCREGQGQVLLEEGLVVRQVPMTWIQNPTGPWRVRQEPGPQR
jgi:hypothetical protein